MERQIAANRDRSDDVGFVLSPMAMSPSYFSITGVSPTTLRQPLPGRRSAKTGDAMRGAAESERVEGERLSLGFFLIGGVGVQHIVL